MARDFDGANDNIAFGSDTSIDQFVTKSIAMWVQKDNSSVAWFAFGKDRFAAAWGLGNSGGGTDNLEFYHQWSGTDGSWFATNSGVGTGLRHIVVTYVGGGTAPGNDPLFYFNNVLQTTVQELTTPTGTIDTDAAANLRCGETGANGADMDGRIGWLNYFNGTFTADDRNRAMWWGKARGDVQVYHPFVTTKLGNEGTGVANGTASGTTVTNSAMITPVVRPGSSLMGFGVGW